MDKQEGALHSFGKQLSELRQERGLTIPELASRSGIDVSKIHAVESGEEDIRITDIFRLAAALGVKPAQLLGSL